MPGQFAQLDILEKEAFGSNGLRECTCISRCLGPRTHDEACRIGAGGHDYWEIHSHTSRDISPTDSLFLADGKTVKPEIRLIIDNSMEMDWKADGYRPTAFPDGTVAVCHWKDGQLTQDERDAYWARTGK